MHYQTGLTSRDWPGHLTSWSEGMWSVLLTKSNSNMEKDNMTNEDWKNFIEKCINDALDARLCKKNEVLIPRARAAKLLAKDVSTLYRWERAGLLRPAVRSGRSIWYKSGDLEKLGAILD